MQLEKALIPEHHIICFQAAEQGSEQVMTRTNISFESRIPSLDISNVLARLALP